MKNFIKSNQGLNSVLNSISQSCIQIKACHSSHLNNKSITIKRNTHGELVQPLDEKADTIIASNLSKCCNVAGYASEEHETFSISNPLGEYIVMYDPLDGSSNIELNITTGTIFCIYKKLSKKGLNENDFLQKGRNIIAAGYFLYGPSLEFVLSFENETKMWRYCNSQKKFILVKAKISGKSEGKYVSFNASLINKSTSTHSEFFKKSIISNEYNFRYVGSLVADFHRNLIEGGIFLYPKTKNHPSGKLRLCYECNPLAYIAKSCQGAATNDTNWILDLKPASIHSRSSLIIGSENMVIDYLSFILTENVRVIGY